MKVFTVTGGTGYIGSKLIEHLTDQGHFVNAIVRESSSIPTALEHKNVHMEIYDGTEDCFEKTIPGSHYVVHLGALYTTNEDDKSTIDLINSNILLSTQIFNAAKRYNQDVVITTASTFSSLDADGNYAPSTLYAATKSAVETIAEYYKELSINFLTFPDTYGPGDWRPKIHNILMRNENWPFEFRSSSKQEMRMLHVDDVIGHILASLHDTEKGVSLYDIYSKGNLVNLKELSELITDKECLFNEESEIVKIPQGPRPETKETGYTNKHKNIIFDFKE